MSEYTAETIAEYIIHLGSMEIVGDEKEKEGVSNLKLQKLLYFFQAHYMGIYGEPLFEDEIEAWEYGPAIPKIYQKYKSWGNKPITNDDCSVSENSLVTANENNKYKSIITSMWGKYNRYSTSYLVHASHKATPWKEAYANTPNNIISKECIRKYYTQSE